MRIIGGVDAVILANDLYSLGEAKSERHAARLIAPFTHKSEHTIRKWLRYNPYKDAAMSYDAKYVGNLIDEFWEFTDPDGTIGLGEDFDHETFKTEMFKKQEQAKKEAQQFISTVRSLLDGANQKTTEDDSDFNLSSYLRLLLDDTA